jgi:hypothetical protein
LILCCTSAKVAVTGGISDQPAKKLGYKGNYSYDELLSIPVRNILLALSELGFNKTSTGFLGTCNAVMDNETGRFRVSNQ